MFLRIFRRAFLIAGLSISSIAGQLCGPVKSTDSIGWVYIILVEASKNWRRILLVLVTALRVVADTTVLGYPATLLPQLRQEGYQTDKYIDSWIASVQGIGMMIGPLFMPFTIDRFGRKNCHILSGLPMAIGWIMILFANNLNMFIIARFIQGLSIGFRSPLSTMVIAESTDPRHRGAFLGTISFSLATGIFYAHFVGTFLDWRMSAVACLFLVVLCTVLLFFFPDSPTRLAKVGLFDQAKQAFIFYRGKSDEANSEIETLISQQIDALTSKDKDKSDIWSAKLKNIVTTFGKVEFYKPVLILFCMYVAYGFAGTYVMASYTIDILKKITGTNLDPYFIMNSVDFFRIFVSVVSCLFIKRYPRRFVYFISLFITIISLTSLAAYIYLSMTYSFRFDYLVLICLLLYIVGIGCGIQSLPYVILGEILPIEHKGLGASVVQSAMSWVYFGSVASGPFLFSNVGETGTFLVYAGVTAGCWLILYFVLPETKDKTLYEIELQFKTKTKMDKGKVYELQQAIEKTEVYA